MKTAIFSGDSDDCREVDGDFYEEEYLPACIVRRKSNPNEGVMIVYTYTGCWAIGLGQIKDDAPIPDWAKNPKYDWEGYTVKMTLTVPDDAEIVWLNEDGTENKEE